MRLVNYVISGFFDFNVESGCKKVNENEREIHEILPANTAESAGTKHPPKSMQQKNYKWISVPLPHMRNQKLFMTQFVVFEHELLQLRRREKYDKPKTGYPCRQYHENNKIKKRKEEIVSLLC